MQSTARYTCALCAHEDPYRVRLPFTKMHGAGNDFVVLDGRDQTIALSTDQARHIADRHRGIGCDQIMLLTPSTGDAADFGYRIFNANGGEVQQCGNGARALALYAHRIGGLPDTLTMQSPAGPVRAVVEGDQIRVDMGPARFAPADIPLAVAQQASRYCVDLDGHAVTFGAVSMGNPHAVVVVDSVSDAPVDALGATLQSHPLFPQSVNVGFMQIVDRRTVHLRVNERGVGETQACGTGACAAVAVGVTLGELDDVVAVNLPGGQLVVDCRQPQRAVWLTGPAHVAFEGHIDL